MEEVLMFILTENENFLQITKSLPEHKFRVSVSTAWKYHSEFI